MSNSADWITSIDRGFQRLLRWIYPGLLIALLFFLSQHTYFEKIVNNNKINLMGYFIGCITLGVIAYLIQTHIIDQILLGFFHKWRVNPSTDERPKCNCKLGKYIDGEADNIERQNRKSEGTGYMDYLWAINHVMFISVWSIILFACLSEVDSPLRSVRGWVIAITVSLLFVGSLYLFAKLVRVRDSESIEEQPRVNLNIFYISQ